MRSMYSAPCASGWLALMEGGDFAFEKTTRSFKRGTCLVRRLSQRIWRRFLDSGHPDANVLGPFISQGETLERA